MCKKTKPDWSGTIDGVNVTESYNAASLNDLFSLLPTTGPSLEPTSYTQPSDKVRHTSKTICL